MIERDRGEVPIGLALTPSQSFMRAALAVRPLNPWTDGHEEAIQTALAEGARLYELAYEVAAHPAASWWKDPMDGRRQVLITDDDRERRDPSQRNIQWEDYAQRPTGWRFTSTLHSSRDVGTAYSCADVVIERGGGDWPPHSEQRRYAAVCNPVARVLEVSTPADWHGLCTTFPRTNRTPGTPFDGTGMLVPDWHQVAGQWDGIHLTFAGLLTIPLVRHSTSAGETMLWSWDTEGTMWLPGDFLYAGERLPAFRKDGFKFPMSLRRAG